MQQNSFVLVLDTLDMLLQTENKNNPYLMQKQESYALRSSLSIMNACKLKLMPIH